jgi:hypothetical protein
VVDANGNLKVPADYRTTYHQTEEDAYCQCAQTLKGWFVVVMDSKNSHSDNSLWGDGWGWSWFDAGNPSKTTDKRGAWRR